MIETGAEIIDIRYPEEYRDLRIPEVRLFPWHELRSQMAQLDQEKKYIVCCNTGPRSAVVSMVLKQHRFDVHYLEGGVDGWPFGTDWDDD